MTKKEMLDLMEAYECSRMDIVYIIHCYDQNKEPDKKIENRVLNLRKAAHNLKGCITALEDAISRKQKLARIPNGYVRNAIHDSSKSTSRNNMRATKTRRG